MQVVVVNGEHCACVDQPHAKFICHSTPIPELEAGAIYTVVWPDKFGKPMTRQLEFVDTKEGFARFIGVNIIIPAIHGIMVGEAPSKKNKRKLKCPCCEEKLEYNGVKLQRIM